MNLSLINGVSVSERRLVALLEPDAYSFSENFHRLWTSGHTGDKGKRRLRLNERARAFGENLMDFWVEYRDHKRYHSWDKSQKNGEKYHQRVWSFEPTGDLRFAAFCLNAAWGNGRVTQVLVFSHAFDKNRTAWGEALKERLFQCTQDPEIQRETARLAAAELG